MNEFGKARTYQIEHVGVNKRKDAYTRYQNKVET